MPSPSKTKIFLASTALVLTLVGAGAGYKAINGESMTNAAIASDSAPQQAPQAMPVTAITVKAEPLRIARQYSGRLEAVDYVDIRPQVSGTITEIRFEDGQFVKQGDVLLVIDPRPYQALVNQSKAEVAAAKNQLELSEKEFKRAEDLIKTNAISQRTYDERSSAYQSADAALQAAKARLDQAQINLDHAYVTAPISGRVSRAELTRGNLVEAGANAPVLTSIVSNDGIYADFEMDEQSYLGYFRTIAPLAKAVEPKQDTLSISAENDTATDNTTDNAIEPATNGNSDEAGSEVSASQPAMAGAMGAKANVATSTTSSATSSATAAPAIPVHLSLRNDDTVYSGVIHSFDNRINTATGTIRARAFFDNTNQVLLPGMFASVSLESPSADQRITVPERAIGTDQDRKFVYVVDENNTVAYREIRLGDKTGSKRIVESGLNEGDVVITEGIIRLRPGMPVTPTITDAE